MSPYLTSERKPHLGNEWEHQQEQLIPLPRRPASGTKECSIRPKEAPFSGQGEMAVPLGSSSWEPLVNPSDSEKWNTSGTWQKQIGSRDAKTLVDKSSNQSPLGWFRVPVRGKAKPQLHPFCLNPRPAKVWAFCKTREKKVPVT